MEGLEARRMLAHAAGHDPVIELPFNEAVGSTTVTDAAAAGGVATGTFEGTILPEVRSTDPSPAGGNYVHFEGSGIFSANPAAPSAGGRISMSDLLNPILGGTSTLSFYIRSTQIGAGSAWQSPGVTGAEQAGGGDDIFWGNRTGTGQSRLQAGDGAASASTPINDGQWYHVTHTRNATTGVQRTYVNGLLVSQVTGDTGVKGSNFRVLGATTNVAADLTTVQGYTHLNGDLDQVEIFNRELTPAEVVRFYAPPATAVPASPAPLTAFADSPTQITLTFTDVENEAGYVIRRSTSAAGPFTEIASIGLNQTRYADRNLTQGTQYFYQVVAFNQAGDSVAATANATTLLPGGADPIIVYNFNEGTGTRVEDVSLENNDNDATLTGDTVPEWRTTDPSPAGGSYLHFEGNRVFNGTGGRVEADSFLNPILGRSATLAYYIRTDQTGLADAWQSPGVTGAEQAGGASDIFWGNLDDQGRARVKAGNGAEAPSTALPGAGWVRVVHTRDMTTGRVRTYVNGNFVSEAVSETGEKISDFRVIGATTNVAGDGTTVQGYSHLNGDLDQIEIYDRALTPQEVAQRYGAPAAAVPGAPAPATATANSPAQVTVNFTDVTGETGYILSRRTAVDGQFTQLAVLGPDTTSYVDNTVGIETDYVYQITPFNAAGNGTPAQATVTTPFFPRNPLIVYNFNEDPAGEVVENTGTGEDAYDGFRTGDQLPTYQTAEPSPAGGQYMRFAVSAPGADPVAPTFQNQGGRVESFAPLHPVLGGTSSISYYIRTTQTGHADAWRSPGVTGAEHAGGGNDVFWGNLSATGQSRVIGGNGAAAASPPINNGQWVQITHTRNATTGVVRTYVNGALAAEATSETGVKGANFFSIGATTDVAGNLTTVQGYNYLNGDLDQIEIYNRELTGAEVSRFYGNGAAPVAEVFVRGTEWMTPTGGHSAFTTYLENKNLGDDLYGYRLFGAGRTPSPSNAHDILPWINMNQLVVRYAFVPSSAGVPTPGNLTVNGVKGAYTVTGVTPVAGDPRSFILTLNKPLGGGNPATGLAPTPDENGDIITLTVPGAGPGGNNFTLRMNVLQGDTDHLNEGNNHVVLARDFAEVKKKFFKSTADVPAGNDTDYDPFYDVDGSGNILARDYAEVKKRFFQSLTIPTAAAAALNADSITSALFGSRRVLG